MTNALRGNATEDCGITCQAPVDALITPYLHCGVAFLALICPARIENPPP